MQDAKGKLSVDKDFHALQDEAMADQSSATLLCWQATNNVGHTIAQAPSEKSRDIVWSTTFRCETNAEERCGSTTRKVTKLRTEVMRRLYLLTLSVGDLGAEMPATDVEWCVVAKLGLQCLSLLWREADEPTCKWRANCRKTAGPEG